MGYGQGRTMSHRPYAICVKRSAMLSAVSKRPKDGWGEGT